MVSRARSKSSAFHDIAHKHGSDEIFAAFQGLDGDVSDFVGCLRLVGLFQLLRKLGFCLLFVVEPWTQDPHREDSMNLDIRSRALSIDTSGTVVHLELLVESVGQRADRGLSRGVRPITGDRNKCEGGTRENKMPLRSSRLLVRGYGRKPFLQCRMSSVGGGPIHRIHLVPQCINWRVDKKPGVTVSSTAPNNVRGGPAIPFGNLFNDPLAIRGFGQVGADVVEFLSSGVQSGTLLTI